MKKLSEILKLAMPLYLAHFKNETLQASYIRDAGYQCGTLCVKITKLFYDGVITKEECRETKAAIQKKIEYYTYLGGYLSGKGRKTTALAQIRFYRAWIKELEREGN